MMSLAHMLSGCTGMQEMGRFPDSGSFDMDTIDAGPTTSCPSSRTTSRSTTPRASAQHGPPDRFMVVSEPVATAEEDVAPFSGAEDQRGSNAAGAAGPGSSAQHGGLHASHDSHVADISDACSDEAAAAAAAAAPLAQSTAVVQGGEVGPDGAPCSGALDRLWGSMRFLAPGNEPAPASRHLATHAR
jgi:hypothetical protein